MAKNPGNARSIGASGPHWLRVPDARGSYTIPHIQSERDLHVGIDFAALPAAAVSATVALRREGGGETRRARVARGMPTADFAALPAGEYALDAVATDGAGAEVWQVGCRAETGGPIGIGSILAALGDSLTEGYLGHGFWRDDLDLSAASFPAAAVSRDRRNFPQFAPTTHRHLPSVNCFQSWLTRLNDRLSEAWRQPVFLANEGWGGYTTGQYLEMMRSNRDGWRDRMERLRPNVWLIHLGVNDDRQQATPETVEDNLRGMVEILRSEFGAAPGSIYLARPSYDYAPGAADLLRRYCARIDALVADLGLRPGPDFFAAFSRDRERWYGSDPVHPGPEGMDWMADLWLEALAPHPPEEAAP